MMDGFDKKRNMVKVLMDMLKRNASDEVSQGSAKQVTLTPRPEVSPVEKISKGHADLHMKEGGMVDLSKEERNLEVPTSEDDVKAMAEGGIADTGMSASDEPERELEARDGASGDNNALAELPEIPHDDVKEQEDRQDLADKNMEYEDEDNNSSSFEAFFPRRKRK